MINRRLRQAHATARPLSKAQARAALRWMPKATMHDITRLRMQRNGQLFLIVNDTTGESSGRHNHKNTTGNKS